MDCETITAEILAERWHVSVRWVEEHTRSKHDPIPHFKRGKKILYLWWNCPDSPLEAWWKRHEYSPGNGSGSGNGSVAGRASGRKVLK